MGRACPFATPTFNQIAPFSVKILHFHFNKSAKLTSSIFFTPNPPIWIGLQTFSQATQYIFLISSRTLQRNIFWILSISFQTEIGALKKAIKKMERLPKTKLINVTLPLIYNILPFQQEKLALPFSNKGLQVANLFGLSPIRIPRKENILSSTLHERKFAAAFRKLVFKLIQSLYFCENWPLIHIQFQIHAKYV